MNRGGRGRRECRSGCESFVESASLTIPVDSICQEHTSAPYSFTHTHRVTPLQYTQSSSFLMHVKTLSKVARKGF